MVTQYLDGKHPIWTPCRKLNILVTAGNRTLISQSSPYSDKYTFSVMWALLKCMYLFPLSFRSSYLPLILVIFYLLNFRLFPLHYCRVYLSRLILISFLPAPLHPFDRIAQ